MVVQEGFIGFASGAVYGLTSLVVGHPLDTLKTKMQAQPTHMQGNALKVFWSTLKSDGLVGLYRGCIPPLLGSSVLRSVQFGVFETVRSYITRPGSSFPIFDVFGIPNTIIVAGMASGAARAAVECPLEVAKIRRQIGESWQFSGLFKGLPINIARNVPLLATFFIFLDQSKKYEHIVPPSWRPFLTGSICSTMAWTIVFPLDVLKSQVQGSNANLPFIERAKLHYRTYGAKGFFRGFGPGATRSLIANGFSMVAYVKTKQYLEGLNKKELDETVNRRKDK